MDSYFKARDILDKAMGTNSYFQIKSILFGLKAADVAEVVYCKDCVYLGRSDFYGECSCGLLGVVGPTDYCSRGARRNKEAVHET